MDYETKILTLKATTEYEKRALTALELKRLAVWEEMAAFVKADNDRRALTRDVILSAGPGR